MHGLYQQQSNRQQQQHFSHPPPWSDPFPSARLQWAARGPDPARGGLWDGPRNNTGSGINCSHQLFAWLNATQLSSTKPRSSTLFVFILQHNLQASPSALEILSTRSSKPSAFFAAPHWPRVQSSPSIHPLGAHSYRLPPPSADPTQLQRASDRRLSNVIGMETYQVMFLQVFFSCLRNLWDYLLLIWFRKLFTKLMVYLRLFAFLA